MRRTGAALRRHPEFGLLSRHCLAGPRAWLSGTVALIAHLSDLHLFANPEEQRSIFHQLCAALARLRLARERKIDLLAITGDVFDSSSVDVRQATAAFADLHARIVDALGGDVPTVVVPGNHDRRGKGLVGPHREELFVALKRSVGPSVWVHGTTTPFLSAVIPQSFHGQRLSLVAYDSTYLPRGLLSAGGVLRQEDLMSAAARVEEDPDDWPAILLVHHHLVPTPLTDLGTIDSNGSPVLKFTLERMLPELIANADREELTMTALGAGTALSTLHSLKRAVLVLHGHKHYATARLLSSVSSRQGDVIVASAGSAGIAERWSPADGDAARLWPAFNLVDVGEGRIQIDTFSFGYKGASAGKVVRRSLVRARQRGPLWEVDRSHESEPLYVGPRLRENLATYRLSPSHSHPDARWDYQCERRVQRADATRPGDYGETVGGAPGSRIVGRDAGGARLFEREVPTSVELTLDGVTRYAHEGGVCRTVGEVERVYGNRSAPYEWLGLMNRYASETARLEVIGLGLAARAAFASATDLGTGIEEPLGLCRGDGQVAVEMAACPPRTLLRLYWPVEAG